MCGIAGYATIGTDRPVDPAHVEPMLNRLAHRGPDDRGVAIFPQVALGNARLSILDLEGGRQPIANADGTTIVVYNGEIYNSPELRRELEAKGRRFRTRTDTEVLVHLYDEVGIDFLNRLNGMFAFALYDRRRDRLILARDRFGVKPLFYAYQNGRLSFASELKALRALPDFDTRLDPEALAVFLGLLYIPDPWTVYAGTRKLRPGHYLELTPAGLREGEFFDFDFSSKLPIDRPEAERQVGELLRRAVGRQLLSDVPVGVLLSSGLDSRSVLAAASERNPGSASFTIAFTESAFDESAEAVYWARRYASPHTRFLCDAAAFCDRLLTRQRQMDEPYGPWCNVATAALAAHISEAGYKVVLSGEGGDELFLGYPTIHAANAARWYRRLPALARTVARASARRLPAGSSRLPVTFLLKSFLEADHPDLIRTFFGFKEVLRHALWPDILTPEALRLVGPIDPAIAFDQYRSRFGGWHFVDALSYLDLKVFLPGSCLMGTDNAFMAASVECRVPMLDNDLADFATGLPIPLRFHPLRPKALLRRALKGAFPEPAAPDGSPPRYRKRGFEVPSPLWLQRPPFGPLLRRILSSPRLAGTGFFRPEAIERLIEDQLAGRQNNERILQAVSSLVLFLDGRYAV